MCLQKFFLFGNILTNSHRIKSTFKYLITNVLFKKTIKNPKCPLTSREKMRFLKRVWDFGRRA